MIVAKESRLVNRNVLGALGRTSIRLEPEMWEALEEALRREGMTCAQFITQIDKARPKEPRTSVVRTWLLDYYRRAATEAGHAKAGHGKLEAGQ